MTDEGQKQIHYDRRSPVHESAMGRVEAEKKDTLTSRLAEQSHRIPRDSNPRF